LASYHVLDTGDRGTQIITVCTSLLKLGVPLLVSIVV
jgi:hypothetical protein